MSFDASNNPVGNATEPKSKKKFWIFGGLGCLGLIGLVCLGIGGGVYVYAWKPMVEFQTQSIEEGISSAEAENTLGTPITSGSTAFEQSGPQSIVFRVAVSGPEKSGTLVFQGKFDGTSWVRESMHLEVDGEEVSLDPDSLFDLQIDEGS